MLNLNIKETCKKNTPLEKRLQEQQQKVDDVDIDNDNFEIGRQSCKIPQ